MAPPALRTERPSRVVQDFPESPQDDAHVAAMDRQTQAMMALVSEIAQAREDFKPAADALHSLGTAQTKFCDFIVNNRVKLLLGGLTAGVSVGAISPTLAGVIKTFLAGFGVQ